MTKLILIIIVTSLTAFGQFRDDGLNQPKVKEGIFVLAGAKRPINFRHFRHFSSLVTPIAYPHPSALAMSLQMHRVDQERWHQGQDKGAP